MTLWFFFDFFFLIWQPLPQLSDASCLPFLVGSLRVLPESSCHLTQSVLCSGVGWLLKGELCWFLHIRRLESDFNLPWLLGLKDQLQSEIFGACFTSFPQWSGSAWCVEGERGVLFWHLQMLEVYGGRCGKGKAGGEEGVRLRVHEVGILVLFVFCRRL